jgi:hypothetical protein
VGKLCASLSCYVTAISREVSEMSRDTTMNLMRCRYSARPALRPALSPFEWMPGLFPRE